MPSKRPTPTIREAAAADLPRLMELLFQLSQQGEVPEGTPEPVSATHQQHLRAMQSGPDATCFVIEDGGRVVGSLTFYVLPNLSHGARPIAMVENVVVDESARGNGYGRLLMEHAEHLAHQYNCYKLTLTSNRRRTDAHRFYDGLGFARSHQGMTKYFGKTKNEG